MITSVEAGILNQQINWNTVKKYLKRVKTVGSCYGWYRPANSYC
jgi:hypothetical protein